MSVSRFQVIIVFSLVVAVSGCTTGGESVDSGLTVSGEPVSFDVEKVESREAFFSFERNPGALLGYRPVMEKPDGGEIFLRLKVNFTNRGEDWIYSPSGYRLSYPDSSVEPERNLVQEGQVGRGVNLSAGESVSGWLVFEAPREVGDFGLKFIADGENYSTSVGDVEYRSRFSNLSAGTSAAVGHGDTGFNITVGKISLRDDNAEVEVSYSSRKGGRRVVLPGRQSFYFSSSDHDDLYSVPVQLNPGERRTETYMVENYSGQDLLKMDLLQGRSEDFIVSWRVG
jgi:hypothetical protein